MYSPVRIVDCCKIEKRLEIETLKTLLYSEVTYPTELCIALHLDTNEEHASVKEEHVAFPASRIVVSLSIDSSWHGPDSCSSHFTGLIRTAF